MSSWKKTLVELSRAPIPGRGTSLDDGSVGSLPRLSSRSQETLTLPCPLTRRVSPLRRGTSSAPIVVPSPGASSPHLSPVSETSSLVPLLQVSLPPSKISSAAEPQDALPGDPCLIPPNRPSSSKRAMASPSRALLALPPVLAATNLGSPPSALALP